MIIEGWLEDYRPRWLSSGINRRDGVTLLCPVCRSIRVGVLFDHDLFTGLEVNDDNNRIAVEGTDLDNLAFSCTVADHACADYVLTVKDNTLKVEL